MTEYGEDCHAFKEYFKEKHSKNKESSTQILVENNIQFESKNGGVLLIIRTKQGQINFYPSTGLYNGAFEGRGVFNLLKCLRTGETK